MAAALATVLLALWWRTPATLTFVTARGDGEAGAWLATGRNEDLPVTFSEGTRVVLAADSRGRVEQLGRSGATFLLERGRVQAHVVHRRETAWRFRAGPFEVEVTGTTLGVEWDPQRERLAVRVDEGSVRVVGPSTGAAQIVRTGEECVVDLPSRTTRVSSLAPDAGSASPTVEAPEDAGAHETPEATVAAPATPQAPAMPTWTRLEEQGDYDGAFAAARARGLLGVLQESSSDELLRFAQVARLSGHREAEGRALSTCRRRFPGSDQAAMAAYQLGRAASGAQAAGWFETYLRERPGGALAREAAGRLVEARASAGDDVGARDAARRYLALYPDGPQAGLARRVLAGGR